jgi:hypothetical protein
MSARGPTDVRAKAKMSKAMICAKMCARAVPRRRARWVGVLRWVYRVTLGWRGGEGVPGGGGWGRRGSSRGRPSGPARRRERRAGDESNSGMKEVREHQRRAGDALFAGEHHGHIGNASERDGLAASRRTAGLQMRTGMALRLRASARLRTGHVGHAPPSLRGSGTGGVRGRILRVPTPSRLIRDV